MVVIPVYNMVVLPKSVFYIQLTQFIKGTGQQPVEGEKVIMLFAKEDQARKELTSDSFMPLAVTGRVKSVNVNSITVIDTLDRVRVESVDISADGQIALTVSAHPEINDISAEEASDMLRQLKGLVSDFSSGYEWAEAARQTLDSCRDLNSMITVFSPFMYLSHEEKYALLEENSCRNRARRIDQVIREFVEMARLMNDGNEKREEDYKQAYRESAIRKQIAYLQGELDKMHPENLTELRKLEMAIESSGMNEEARREADKVLSRMKNEGENSQEYAMLFSYAEYLSKLPWKKAEAETIDLQEAERTLDSEHFGLKKVKDRIIQQIAVMDLKKVQSGSILCFVGAPGTGKTSIGKSIAEALHRKYVRVSLGGVRDEADIRGHRRTYIGAMPGRIINGISKAGVSNPVMVLDEIDKLSASYNGDPASALLEVLDPEQNASFTDHYLNVPFDLSDVLFICTANTLDTIPEPLLNRMEVIRFSGYTETEKFQIARRHLIPRAAAGMGIPEDHLEITDEALHAIISDYTMEGGVRGLKKRLDTLCRTAAVRLVSGHMEKLVIEKDKLREYLDMRPIHHEPAAKENRPGVVTGLAWTQAGGDILYIETLFTRGSGKTIITGQLGDVMKESAQIAVSLVKSLYPDKADLFDKNDLHIHVPEGAVPKDGPSAGITLTTALSSLVSGQAVDPRLAMTGEVSLRGLVSPIGGLPEKLMAAKRAGIDRVFIPAENQDDLDEVADEIKDSLNIIPVSSVMEVLRQTRLADRT